MVFPTNSLIIPFIAFVGVIIVGVEAQFDDVRCKCVCPQDPANNLTRNIYIKNVIPEQCSCAHIVKREEKFCLLCECKYEIRNTTTIKVMVIFVVCLIGVLFAYMMIMMCLDYILSHRSTPHTQRLDDEGEMTPIARRRGGYFQRMESATQRWKRQVQEQKKNVFDRHAMLS
ncbi:proton-transporting V-type ATPase complex assembly regulator TMEM9-like [Saccoglossus kowalevskii]|uniref:Transmembrane protein 9-like n=1 Tax=Saccoglossus kowalevskii TaxID=10224 RepID=A0ABM0M1A5_SACKO|nr:PREDICTED: transmembrane protein 9-like [Saccoglossus kowalevskii]